MNVFHLNAEPLGGEDDPDSGPESAGHLTLVRGGQEGPGECECRVRNTQSCHAGNTNTVIYFAGCNLKIQPVNTRVLIPAVTFDNNHGSGHGV